MQKYDLAGQPARLTQIMGRHHDFDAALGHGLDDVFDGFRRGRIEARSGLVEEQQDGVAGERSRQRQSLLLAAGQPPRGPVLEAAEADQRK